MNIVAGIILGLVCTVGVLLTLLGLPGTWIMLLAGLGIELWQPELLGREVLITSAVLCVLAEAVEFIAGAVGAKKAGGSKRAAVGAVIGGLVGGIVGTVVILIPIVGTLLGASLGAGIGAAALELTLEHRRTMDSAGKVAAGAFIGRLLATVFKTMFAVSIAALLVAAVCIPGW